MENLRYFHQTPFLCHFPLLTVAKSADFFILIASVLVVCRYRSGVCWTFRIHLFQTRFQIQFLYLSLFESYQLFLCSNHFICAAFCQCWVHLVK